jgi:hypothetical protein
LCLRHRYAQEWEQEQQRFHFSPDKVGWAQYFINNIAGAVAALTESDPGVLG